MTFPLDPAAPVPPDGEPQNPWRRPPTALERLMNDGRTADDIAADAWDKGFAAGRAAASPDPPDEEATDG